MFSRAPSPAALAPNGEDSAPPDNRPYGSHAQGTGTDISGNVRDQGNGQPYPDSDSWSGPLSSELGWRPTTFASDLSSSDLDDILGRPTGVPDGWDSMRFGYGASYPGSSAIGGTNSIMGDSAANGGNGAGGINDILAALGMGQEPQATFDTFFLHPLPDFPTDDWAV